MNPTWQNQIKMSHMYKFDKVCTKMTQLAKEAKNMNADNQQFKFLALYW